MRLLVAASFILTAVFYYSFSANDLSAGFTSDDAVYLLLADLYTFAEQTQLPVYNVIREQALFPPMFPLLLGALGGGSAAPAQAAMISTGLLLVSILMAGRWLLQQTNNLSLTMVLTGMLLLLPGTLIFAQEIWSEFLFMLLLYGIFMVAGRDVPSRQHWLILAVLIAFATLTRTAGVALLPPFWLLLYRYKVRPFWLPATFSTLPFLAWYIPREVFRDSPGYTSTLSSTVGDTGVAILLERIPDKLVSMFESLRWLFSAVDSGPVHLWSGRILLMVLLVLAARVLLQRLLAFRLDALFCIVYGGMIFIWPYDDVYYMSRFLYPLLPVFMLYTVIGITDLASRRSLPLFTMLSLAAALFISAPSVYQFMQRSFAEVVTELKPYRRDRTWLLSRDANETVLENTRFIITTLQKIPDSVAQDECIYTLQAPLVMLYTKRIAGILPAPTGSDEQFRRETAVCRYILAMPITDAARNTPEYYPMQRLAASEYEQTVFYANPRAEYGTAIYLLRRFADTIAP